MRAQLRRINTSALQLAAAFLLGVLWGTFVALLNDAPPDLSIESGISLVSLLWLPLLVLFLGTSVLGSWAVPMLMILRGYMLSASFSLLLIAGVDLKTAVSLTALPAVFSVPAFFLLCEEAVSSSRIIRLCSESGLTRRCEYIRPVRLLVTVFLLLFAAAAQIYLVPQIV